MDSAIMLIFTTPSTKAILRACCKSASLGVESRFWKFLDVERAPKGSIAPFRGRFSVVLRYLSVDTAGPRDGSDFCNRLLRNRNS